MLSESNLCIYIYKDKQLIVLVYVDNIIIVSLFKDQMQWFKTQFVKAFKIKILRELKKILEIKIERDRANRVIRLSQIMYIRKILQGLNMEKNKHRDKIDISLNNYDDISSADLDE